MKKKPIPDFIIKKDIIDENDNHFPDLLASGQLIDFMELLPSIFIQLFIHETRMQSEYTKVMWFTVKAKDDRVEQKRHL